MDAETILKPIANPSIFAKSCHSLGIFDNRRSPYELSEGDVALLTNANKLLSEIDTCKLAENYKDDVVSLP